MISSFTIARNVVKLGYPIKECVGALAAVSEQVIVCYDPTTDDGTDEVCKQLKETHDVKLVEEPWDMENRNAGTEIGRITDVALGHCYFDWNLHCQLDEGFHEEDKEALHELVKYAPENVGGFEFQRVCFYAKPTNVRKDWTIRTVRLTKKGTHSYATLDGHNCVPIVPNHRPFIPNVWIYHYQRFGDSSLITQRIRVLDGLFHAEENLPKFEDVKPYDFKLRNIDSCVKYNPEIKEVQPEFFTYEGTHPAAFRSFIYGE